MTVDVGLVAGRLVPRINPVSGRADIHEFLLDAVTRSGGRVLYASNPARVPVYIGLEDRNEQRLGLMIYPFRMNRLRTRNRPSDEIRGQLRYGAEETWPGEDHFVARDIAGVDTTPLAGVYPEEDLLLGNRSTSVRPAAAGNQRLREGPACSRGPRARLDRVGRKNHARQRRAAPRAAEGLETFVGFRPGRPPDYARFERRASELGLDPPLRYAAAGDAAARRRNSQVASRWAQAGTELRPDRAPDPGHHPQPDAAGSGGQGRGGRVPPRQRPGERPCGGAVAALDQDAQPDFDVRLRTAAAS